MPSPVRDGGATDAELRAEDAPAPVRQLYGECLVVVLVRPFPRIVGQL